MTYLLDTHYMLWAIMDTKKLSKKLVGVIVNTENQIIVSAISFWEVSLKYSLGKLFFENFNPNDLHDSCLQMGFNIAPLSATDSSTFYLVKATYHKDPFDRMLIWQAIQNDYTLITTDNNVKRYVSEGLKIY